MNRPSLAVTQTALCLLSLCICTGYGQTGQGRTADCSSILQQAQELIQQQQADQAAGMILSALRTCPSDAQAYALLGISLDEQQKYAEAQRAFLKAISLNPSWAPFRTNLAVSYLHAKNAPAAIGQFREALRLDPSNRVASFNLADYYAERNQFGQALRYVSEIHPDDLEDGDQLMLLVKIYLGTGDLEKASEVARRLSSIGAGEEKLHFSLGLLFAEFQQPAEAVRQFELVPVEVRDYATYQNLGLAYEKIGDSSQARANLETAKRLAPENPDPYLELAKLSAAERRPDDSLSLLSEANRQAPQRVDVVFALAELLIQMSRFEQAGDLLAEQIKQHPNNAMLLQAQGDLLQRRHLDPQAIQAYSASLRIDPRWVDARIGLARLYWIAGNTPQAHLEYAAVLRAAPDCAPGNAAMGALAFGSGQIKEAIGYLNRSLTEEPDNLAVGEMLATAYVREGDYAQADKILRRLIEVSPSNSQVHYLEGRALSKLGKNVEAQSEFEKARQFASGITPENGIQAASTGCSRQPASGPRSER